MEKQTYTERSHQQGRLNQSVDSVWGSIAEFSHWNGLKAQAETDQRWACSRQALTQVPPFSLIRTICGATVLSEF